MQSIKVILRNYKTKKDGKGFSTLRAKGQYLPLATVDVNVNYNVRLCGTVQIPKDAKEGIYEVAFENGGLWHDTRPEFVAKDIIRVRATRIVYQKPLPVFERDIRVIDKAAK